MRCRCNKRAIFLLAVLLLLLGWYYFSDRSYHKATLSEVLNAQAYLLFYERLGDIDGDGDEAG